MIEGVRFTLLPICVGCIKVRHEKGTLQYQGHVLCLNGGQVTGKDKAS